MQEWLLEFEQVDYTYLGAQQSALNGLNLRIPAHKRCALIGQNGCGKTTLFLLANGLYKPNTGSVYWQGKAFKYDRNYLMKLRQKVGLIFQDPEQQLGRVGRPLGVGQAAAGERPADRPLIATEAAPLRGQPMLAASTARVKRRLSAATRRGRAPPG